MFNAIAYASSEFGKYDIKTEGLKITFDDSIIEDKESESNRALREVQAGVLSKSEYRQKIFAETKEIADEKIKEIEKQNPSIKDLIGE